MNIKRVGIAFAAMILLAISPAKARHYDCSKPGNATKAACKGNAAKTAPVPPAVATAPAKDVMTKPRNYDCTKLGNKFRAACRGQSATAPTPTPQAAARPGMIAQPGPTGSGGQMPHAGSPNGATAMCKDGTYSHSAHHSGSCSRHGGVAQFLQ